MPRYPSYQPGGPGYYPKNDNPQLGPRIWPNGNGPNPGPPLQTLTFTRNAFAQAQADIKVTSNAFGQAQGDIKQTYQQYAQAQADIKQTYQQYGQAQADIKATNQQYGQAQGDIKAVGYGFGQANCDIKATNQQYAQAQGYIPGSPTQYGQAQADIKQTYQQYSQAQADIKATSSQFGQAQATVQGNAFGQAQATIRGNVFAQAQADIKQTYQQFAQAQGYVSGAITQYAQAQAFIRKSAGYGQARALIASILVLDLFDRVTDTNTPGTPTIGPAYRFDDIYTFVTNAISDINGTNLTVSYGDPSSFVDGEILFPDSIGTTLEYYIEFTPDTYFDDPSFVGAYAEFAVADIDFFSYAGTFLQTHDESSVNFYVEIQIEDNYELAGPVFVTIENGTTYAMRWLLVGPRIRGKLWKLNDPEPDWLLDYTHSSNNPLVGAVNPYYFVDPFDATPTSTTFDNWNVLSTQAPFPGGFGQAQADILHTYNQFAQAQATIIRRLASGQAQAKITAIGVNKFAQAQAKISKGALYGQANADIKKTTRVFAQARAQINQSKQTGQAQADILKTTNKFAQARAKITHTLYQSAQVQADIKARGRAFAQAQAFITYTSTKSAQAQAQIHRFEGYGQANALIDSPIKNQYGQAQGQITRPIRHAQAQAYILHPQIAQAQALIRKYPFQFAQAQTDIKVVSNTSGQAQAKIVNSQSYAQAQAYILSGSMHGQAQAMIIVRGKVFAQAQGYINRSQGYGQAQAVIKHGFSGQAQAYIRLAVFKTGLAQGLIINPNVSVVQTKFGNAQGFIRKTVKCGQAQALIKSKRTASGQAQAQIVRGSASGQAQAFISGGRYIVQFNGQQLPGFAQTEEFDSPEDISDNYAPYRDATFSEYLGLQNKILSLKMRVMGTDLADVKSQISEGATILRSKRSGFTKTYIQRADRYYLTIVKTVTTEHDVRTNKVADYTVSFEAKPWVISTTTYSASGTGLISTATRTLYDGGFTPTRVRVTGTDVTISGYTASEFTGYISISGAVANMSIDSDALTATIGGVNKNNLMNNIDYALHVGPGITYFQIDGATECVIEWEDRWYL